MFESLKSYFPSLAEEVVDYRKENQFELYVRTRDGDSYIFDDGDKTIRRLPNNSRDLTEIECRNEFGRRLRKMMFRKNVTQIELSERTGISQTLLSRYIMGKSNPGFYNVDKIAKALDCSVDDFRYV